LTVFYSAMCGDTTEMIVFEFKIITGTTHLSYKLVRILWPEPNTPDDIYTTANLCEFMNLIDSHYNTIFADV